VNNRLQTYDKKRSLGTFAQNFKIDPDEVLLNLWDKYNKKGEFSYLKDSNVQVKRKDINRVKNIIRSLKTQVPIEEVMPEVTPVKLIKKDFDYSNIGRNVGQLSFISSAEILQVHEELERDFDNQEDPIAPKGVKDMAMLESALYHPQTSYKNNFKYPTIESAAAALMYSISQNHSFHNGNKRAAIVAVLIFLDRHNISLTCTEDELFKVSLDLASHALVNEEYRYQDAEIYKLANWIHNNSKVIRKGERPITLRKLKRILSHFGCEIMDNGRVIRNVTTTGIFGRSRKDTLVSKKLIGHTISEGDEVALSLIKSIREDLQLISAYGVDSDSFYKEGQYTSSEFIIKYKNLLRRLSKF